MDISIIGLGKFGIPLAKHIANAGHKVTLGSRDTQKSIRIADEIAHDTVGGSIDNAMNASNIIFLTVPHNVIHDTIKSIGSFTGKVFVDVSNCFTPDFTGLTIGHTSSAAEEIAKLIPGAAVVKAFSTVFATILDKGLDFGNNPLNIFYAGDDEDATTKVRELIQSLGLVAVDCGPLRNARFIEPMTALVLQIDNKLARPVQIAPAIAERTRPT